MSFYADQQYLRLLIPKGTRYFDHRKQISTVTSRELKVKALWCKENWQLNIRGHFGAFDYTNTPLTQSLLKFMDGHVVRHFSTISGYCVEAVNTVHWGSNTSGWKYIPYSDNFTVIEELTI
jgi:hypothetical protein